MSVKILTACLFSLVGLPFCLYFGLNSLAQHAELTEAACEITAVERRYCSSGKIGQGRNTGYTYEAISSKCPNIKLSLETSCGRTSVVSTSRTGYSMNETFVCFVPDCDRGTWFDDQSDVQLQAIILLVASGLLAASICCFCVCVFFENSSIFRRIFACTEQVRERGVFVAAPTEIEMEIENNSAETASDAALLPAFITSGHHPHALRTKGKATQKNEAWFCDVCGISATHMPVGTLRFGCTEGCDWDMCGMCQRQEASVVGETAIAAVVTPQENDEIPAGPTEAGQSSASSSGEKCPYVSVVHTVTAPVASVSACECKMAAQGFHSFTCSLSPFYKSKSSEHR